jgi:hypothetical protein
MYLEDYNTTCPVHGTGIGTPIRLSCICCGEAHTHTVQFPHFKFYYSCLGRTDYMSVTWVVGSSGGVARERRPRLRRREKLEKIRFVARPSRLRDDGGMYIASLWDSILL